MTLPGGALCSAQKVEPRGAECDEQRADSEPHRPSALIGRADEDREAEHDREHPEDQHRPAVDAAHAAALPAATIRRTGACLSTKSTVSPKIARLPAASFTRRGPPMTMISAPRRTASSTIARPEFRARTMRETTFTPYESPIARASSSCSCASRTSSGRYASSLLLVSPAHAQRRHGGVRDREREHGAERVHASEEVHLAREDEERRRDAREHDEREPRRLQLRVQPAEDRRQLPVRRHRVGDARSADYPGIRRDEENRRCEDA